MKTEQTNIISDSWDVMNFIKILREQKTHLKENFKVKNLGIFGSYVRNEQNSDSDVDILVEFEEPVDLFLFLDLEDFLNKLLNRKIDLAIKTCLKPYISKQILSEVFYV